MTVNLSFRDLHVSSVISFREQELSGNYKTAEFGCLIVSNSTTLVKKADDKIFVCKFSKNVKDLCPCW